MSQYKATIFTIFAPDIHTYGKVFTFQLGLTLKINKNAFQ